MNATYTIDPENMPPRERKMIICHTVVARPKHEPVMEIPAREMRRIGLSPNLSESRPQKIMKPICVNENRLS